MNTDLFIENSFSLTPNDILQDRHHGSLKISYWTNDATDLSDVSVSVKGGEPQKINLEWEEITYGQRAYFQCSCGLRVNKIYLPADAKEFKCRKCHKLLYQLTTFNRHTNVGQFLYKQNRMQKLMESREKMGRILYKNNFTKRFERFLNLCNKAGLDDVVKGANTLKELIAQ
ncbi:hypothetical protein A2W67_02600 [Candidatus Nomurabacteria bacterium RIFCSPLOWO2_02_40_28]|uniref:Uncharacterized protein n=2 Tax=Candidatus Nomuraibacteriota TaxID=1752729 RepID=A0A837HTU8_9BACT|nr:MAG: hypothetical protein UT27_C0007G0027 [Candidatus Nomurabacteria bacterium GW2011_GWD2_39_12]KKR20372.1 MAG: hypothetical protein UT51_C0004G0031 [Candidatus Nomurabacteria bacterium GW2011_GWC2_39_41]KKR37089.1 MAG: hypothetical protein UT70_C0003G0031 [Candidatus Nomurabacteria bacterium GW2011_GWE2_40_10]KKR38300.1 MAG: hypothetical protein UT73_C0004G0045 [Candidatus Nomurabacteria bacterium GW2011_GWB1_40_11]KKR39814.1 MAG: hypothetical protein UT74_C0005G0031 [Parcubacteria group b